MHVDSPNYVDGMSSSYVNVLDYYILIFKYEYICFC